MHGHLRGFVALSPYHPCYESISALVVHSVLFLVSQIEASASILHYFEPQSLLHLRVILLGIREYPKQQRWIHLQLLHDLSPLVPCFLRLYYLCFILLRVILRALQHCSIELELLKVLRLTRILRPERVQKGRSKPLSLLLLQLAQRSERRLRIDQTSAPAAFFVK